MIGGPGPDHQVGPTLLLADHLGTDDLHAGAARGTRSRCGRRAHARNASMRPAPAIALVAGQSTASGHFPAATAASVHSRCEGSLKSPVSITAIPARNAETDVTQETLDRCAARLARVIDGLLLAVDERAIATGCNVTADSLSAHPEPVRSPDARSTRRSAGRRRARTRPARRYAAPSLERLADHVRPKSSAGEQHDVGEREAIAESGALTCRRSDRRARSSLSRTIDLRPSAASGRTRMRGRNSSMPLGVRSRCRGAR